jgi:hypothetical protein
MGEPEFSCARPPAGGRGPQELGTQRGVADLLAQPDAQQGVVEGPPPHRLDEGLVVQLDHRAGARHPVQGEQIALAQPLRAACHRLHQLAGRALQGGAVHPGFIAAELVGDGAAEVFGAHVAHQRDGNAPRTFGLTDFGEEALRSGR